MKKTWILVALILIGTASTTSALRGGDGPVLLRLYEDRPLSTMALPLYGLGIFEPGIHTLYEEDIIFHLAYIHPAPLLPFLNETGEGTVIRMYTGFPGDKPGVQRGPPDFFMLIFLNLMSRGGMGGRNGTSIFQTYNFSLDFDVKIKPVESLDGLDLKAMLSRIVFTAHYQFD